MDLKISEMLDMQRELQEKYRKKWGGTPPEKRGGAGRQNGRVKDKCRFRFPLHF